MVAIARVDRGHCVYHRSDWLNRGYWGWGTIAWVDWGDRVNNWFHGDHWLGGVVTWVHWGHGVDHRGNRLNWGHWGRGTIAMINWGHWVYRGGSGGRLSGWCRFNWGRWLGRFW